jgi:hypothetical protein
MKISFVDPSTIKLPPFGKWTTTSEMKPMLRILACDTFGQIFIPDGTIQINEDVYDAHSYGYEFNVADPEEFLKGAETGVDGMRILPRKIIAWMPLPEPYQEGCEE